MSRPRLLDLFCGAGGAAMGYYRAGFDVVGVDIRPQSRYPFEFHRADAMTYPLDGFDAIHASPPCQRYSIATAGAGKHVRASHPALIAPTRERLRAVDVPFVIENVPLAPLVAPLTLCGTMFNLTASDEEGPLFLRRHRLFESNVILSAMCRCRCREWKAQGWWIGGVYGGGRASRYEARFVRHGGYAPRSERVRCSLMGIDWMTQKELNESVPPAYTRYIGGQLIVALRERAA